MTNGVQRIIATPSAPAPARVGQATAVEQSRAVAEVQAAVVVAQNIPRDMTRAEAEMKDACRRMALANRAFYSVPNRGNGPSVHLARELARIWGNVQYGVHELRRDDDAGESEVQAFAWDVQTNTRSTRTFVNPHARMANRQRQKLTDLGDIYLSNQNVGARAVRECIFSVLPTWFTEAAQDICKQTLEHGEGEPLADRITKMVAAFKGIGVTVDQLEQKISRRRGAWTAGDVAQMVITYTSITRDGLSKDEEFPPQRVTADEITNATKATPPAAEGDRFHREPEMAPAPPASVTVEPQPQPEQAAPVNGAAKVRMQTAGQRKRMFGLFDELGFAGDENREQRLAIVTRILGPFPEPLESTSDLSYDEMERLNKALEVRRDQVQAQQAVSA